jgi:hypothetical protein
MDEARRADCGVFVGRQGFNGGYRLNKGRWEKTVLSPRLVAAMPGWARIHAPGMVEQAKTSLSKWLAAQPRNE